VVVDLEDAVLPAARPAAREHLRAWFERLAVDERATVTVRINGTDSPDHADDVACLLSLDGLGGCLFPKFGEPTSLLAAETLGDLPVVGLVETPAGLLEISQLKDLPSNTVRLAFGAGDFASDLGVVWSPGNPVLSHARMHLALASRRLNLPPPIDTAFPWLNDLAGLEVECNVAKASGYGGKFCIHPSQVPVVADVFGASVEERDWATKVLAAVEAQGADGAGAFQLDGALIDEAVVKRARAIRDELPTSSPGDAS
jgi:citrate lyase subunit beta/citryl-CoA lyase